MKFKKETTVQGGFVPRSALKLSGLAEEREVELQALPGAMVIFRKQMTAMQLFETIESLTDLVTELVEHILQNCGTCEDCEEDGCPCSTDNYLELPDCFLQEAGIPQGAKLCAFANPESGTVTVSQAGYAHDLRDVPPALLAMLQNCGICLGELEERLMTQEVVYG